MNDRFRPDLYSYVARHLVAPLWAWKEKSPYLSHFERLKDADRRPIGEVRRAQWARFRELLGYVWDTVPFYRRRLEEAGLVPDDFRHWAALTAMPVLTKDDIRENAAEMIAGGRAPESLVRMRTSGSTGVSLTLYMDEASRQWKRACTLKYDMWAGWRLGERIGAVWGNPESRLNWRMWLRNLLLTRHICLDTLQMDEETMYAYYRTLMRKKPTLLFGHAHSLYLFARFLKENYLWGVRPRGVISTAMVLHDFERRLIEQVFGCKVTNRYGCEEVSLIACECEAHSGMHVNLDTLIFECLDAEGHPVPPGEPGAVVVTDLTNFAMPVIRYKVGDVAVMRDDPCSCGRSYPLISRLVGRIADYVRTPDGRFISGISLTENFAMALPGVKQLQIIQEKLDYLTFRIARDSGWDEAGETVLRELVARRFGEEMRYGLEFVEAIPAESSGKYRFCISRLEESAF